MSKANLQNNQRNFPKPPTLENALTSISEIGILHYF